MAVSQPPFPSGLFDAPTKKEEGRKEREPPWDCLHGGLGCHRHWSICRHVKEWESEAGFLAPFSLLLSSEIYIRI